MGRVSGPLVVAMAYGQSTVQDSAPLHREIRTLSLGAAYDFGSLRLMGALSRVQDRYGAAGLSGRDRYAGVLFGAVAALGHGQVRASLSRVGFEGTQPQAADPQPHARKWALGYAHHLSRRTTLYATVARTTVSHAGSRGGAVLGAVPGASPGFPTSGGAVPGSALAMDVGVRHAF